MSERITGFFRTDKSNVPFIFEDFLCTFLPIEILYNNKINDECKITPDSCGFIHAKMYNGESISFYAGKNTIEISTRREISFPCYIIHKNIFHNNSERNPNDYNALYITNEFDAIEFHGDDIDEIVKFNLNRSKTNNVIFDEEIEITNDLCQFIISEYKLYTNNTANSKRCEGSSFIFNFNNTVNLHKLFDVYNTLISLCQFMHFRKDIKFTRINLKKHFDDYPSLLTFATCYFRDDMQINTPDKEPSYCVRTNDLTPKNIIKLVDIFKYKGDNQQSWLRFIPESKKDKNTMSYGRVKEIASAIENELSFQDLEKSAKKVKDSTIEISINDESNNENLTDKEKLEKLTKCVKAIVKEHRKSTPFNNHMIYDNIFSNISHWSYPLSSKIIDLCNSYDEIIKKVSCNGNRYNKVNRVDEDSVKAFVKYRNNISHGNMGILDIDIAKIAINLEAVIYISILKRAGVNDKKIVNIISRVFNENDFCEEED